MNPLVRRLRRSAIGPAGRLFRATSKPIGGGGGLRRAALAPLGLLRRPLRDAARRKGRDGHRRLVGDRRGGGAADRRRRAATVLLVARSAGGARADLAAEINSGGPGVAEAMPCDLNDLDAIDALAERVLAAHGRRRRARQQRRALDPPLARALAGSLPRLRADDAAQLLRGGPPDPRLLPAMRERGGGQVINISSAGVQMRTPRFSGYIASKAALEAFSDAIQAEALATAFASRRSRCRSSARR